MLNGALVIEVFNCDRTCDEKLWSFDKARNVLIEKKKKIWHAKYISTRIH